MSDLLRRKGVVPFVLARQVLLGGVLGLIAGCAVSGGRINPPSLSPEAASQAAMAQYDQNKDGYLDAKELEACPALKSSLKKFDKDHDGRLSAQEITERLQVYTQQGVGLISKTCRVLLDGQALAGAKVTFVPETFLGSGFKPASGTSDTDGYVRPQVEGMNVPGIQPGLYRVQIAKPNDQGQETIPSRYNAQTRLGFDVPPDATGREEAADEATFRLSSK